jgi:hypothetical protein
LNQLGSEADVPFFQSVLNDLPPDGRLHGGKPTIPTGTVRPS